MCEHTWQTISGGWCVNKWQETASTSISETKTKQQRPNMKKNPTPICVLANSLCTTGNESFFVVAAFPNNIMYKVIITAGVGAVHSVLEFQRISCSGFTPKAQFRLQLCNQQRNTDADGFRNGLLFRLWPAVVRKRKYNWQLLKILRTQMLSSFYTAICKPGNSNEMLLKTWGFY